MTFQPARPAEPAQGGQPPTDTPDAVLDEVEAAVDAGRNQLQDARSSALRAAESAAERDAINARFDQLDRTFGEGVGRIEQAIATGNTQLLEGLREFMASARADAGGAQGMTGGDDDIVSVEEIIDDALEGAAAVADAATDGLAGAADAATDAAEDVLPKRDHPLFRRLWGG